jgi:hypothetical protein
MSILGTDIYIFTNDNCQFGETQEVLRLTTLLDILKLGKNCLYFVCFCSAGLF